MKNSYVPRVEHHVHLNNYPLFKITPVSSQERQIDFYSSLIFDELREWKLRKLTYRFQIGIQY
jgi:hypothetical protein